MHAEFFVEDTRYNLAVERMTDMLRLIDAGNLGAARKGIADLFTAFDALGLDAGREDYSDLAAALAALEPVGHEEIDPCQVKLVLGEHGNIWPAAIREDVEAERVRERAREHLAAGKRVTGPILAGVTALTRHAGGVARHHVQAIADDAERQAVAHA